MEEIKIERLISGSFHLGGNTLKRYLEWTQWLLSSLIRTEPGTRVKLGVFWLVNVGDNSFSIVTDEGQLTDGIESLL